MTGPVGGTSERVVWKHPLPGEVNILMLHRGAEILHVAQQGNSIQLWEVHAVDEEVRERRQFRIAGTGNPFPGSGRHVGSLLAASGIFVFHVFEEPA